MQRSEVLQHRRPRGTAERAVEFRCDDVELTRRSADDLSLLMLRQRGDEAVLTDILGGIVHAGLDVSAVRVHVEGSQVRLIGIVSDPTTHHRLVSLCTGVRGVLKIDDQLLVEPNRRTIFSLDHRGGQS